MERLFSMAYFGQNICEELAINQPGSLEPVWKRYDETGGDPLIIPQLRRLYIRYENVCPGFWSFMRECFPNCEVILR